MRFRLTFAGVALFLDLLLMPLLINYCFLLPGTPLNLTQSLFVDEVIKHFYLAPNLLFQNHQVRSFWAFLQPAVLAFLVWILWRTSNSTSNKSEGPEAAGSGQYGTARWRTQKEIDRDLITWIIPQKDSLPKAGIVVGGKKLKKTFKAWMDSDEGHVLLIGSTGSGKTRKIIYPTVYVLAQEVISAGESMILTDPKGQLYNRCHNYLREKGYNVVKLDFRNPEKGNRWNPMDPVVRAIQNQNLYQASEAAWDFAHTIVHQKHFKGDPIWPNGQESVISALTLAVALEAPHLNQKHFTSVYNLLTKYGQTLLVEEQYGKKTALVERVPLNDYMDSLPLDHLARAAFGTAALAPYKTRASFYAGASSDLRLWSDPSVAYMTGAQDHKLGRIGQEKTAIFLIIPDERSTRYVLASLYISQAYLALIDAATSLGGKLPVRVNFLLDEFGNLPPIHDFDTKITVSRDRNIRFLLAIQGLDQVKEKYGGSANTITGNCRTWIYLKSNDEETKKLISQKTGQYTIKTESRSSQYRDRDMSSGISQGLTGRPLLTPHEVGMLNGQAILFQEGKHAARLPVPDLSEWPADSVLIPVEDGLKGVISDVPIWLPFSNHISPGYRGFSVEPEVMEMESDDNILGDVL